jgi:hypothetical protein
LPTDGEADQESDHKRHAETRRDAAAVAALDRAAAPQTLFSVELHLRMIGRPEVRTRLSAGASRIRTAGPLGEQRATIGCGR